MGVAEWQARDDRATSCSRSATPPCCRASARARVRHGASPASAVAPPRHCNELRPAAKSENSFGARPLRRARVRDIPPRRPATALRRGAPAVLVEGAAREPVAHRGQRVGDGGRHRSARHLGRQGQAQQGDRLHPGARPDAGLHGVPAVVDLAAMRDAMVAMGGDPRQDRPARARRARDRPLRAGRRVRHARRLQGQRRARVRAQPGALLVPALGSGRVRRASRSCRPTLASCTRSTSSIWRGSCSPPRGSRDEMATHRAPRAHGGLRKAAPVQAYPDTLVGTDSHTTMVNGLGVLGWGVGGIEAEAAMLGQPMSMLIPRVLGFKLHGVAARGRDRHRPGADRHRDAARARRGGHVRRVLRRRARRPAARRPRHDRQHVARVRLDLRDLPDRRRDAALPGVLRAPARADRAGRGLLRASRACGTTSTPRSPPSPI